MPLEQHSDPFEEQLSAGMRHAAGAFETDRAALVTAGAARGRRRLLLRRRAAVAGGAAGLALVGVGGALLVPGAGSGADKSSVAAEKHRTKAPAPVSGDALIRTLEKLLPSGTFSGAKARGSADKDGPFVHVVLDDGKGAAAVEVGLGRVEPGSDQARQATECPGKAYAHYDSCRTDRLQDGSVVMVLQGYEYPDRRVDTKWWSAELVSPQGHHVSVGEWNAAAEKDSPVTRSRPPLSPARLKHVAAAAAWREAIDTMPVHDRKPTARPSASASPTPSFAPVAPTLRSLLPKGLTVAESSGDDGGFGYVVADDGKGKSLVQVNVQGGMSDVAGDLFGSGAETLPDGTRVAVHQGPGEKGGAGVVMWTVDTLRTDGTRVVVSAFNSGAQDTAATRTTPVLTIAQLRQIALNPKWFL
ncbi:hypothetical protein ACIRPX_10880 [Streptomyces sp. NPDC101225]|uniref:hypothetical protein n=1 Tax=Streptomyces sp. NPDC101225 TaxID=3366135 RepID=UPI00382FB22E